MGGKLDTHRSPQHMGQGETAVPIGSSTLHAHETNLALTRGRPTTPTKYNYTPKDNLTDFNNDTIASPYRMDDYNILPDNQRPNHHQCKALPKQRDKSRDLTTYLYGAPKMSTHEPDGDTNRFTGTALQRHSTSALIKALNMRQVYAIYITKYLQSII